MPAKPNAPLEAFVLPDPPPPRGRGRQWVLVIGLLTLVVGLVSAAIWGMGRLATGLRGGPSDPASLIDHWETPSERLANIKAAMNAGELNCGPGELRDFQRVLGRVVNAARNDDDAAWRSCVDINQMVRRIGRHPAARSDPALYSWTLKSELQSGLESPTGLGEQTIVRVERGRREDQALVYTVEGNYYQTCAFRWWLARNGRNWRVVDYERLDHGQTLAEAWAVRGAIERDPNKFSYYSQQTTLGNVDNTLGGQMQATDSAQLDALLYVQLPEIVHDIGRLDLAWSMIGQNLPASALKACDGVKKPDEHAGVHLVRAQALEMLQQSKQALESAGRYQQLAGRDPQALVIEANALEQLDDYAAAAGKWRELLALCPHYDEAQRNFARLADARQRAELPQILARLTKPVEAAVEQANAALYRDDFATYDALVEFIRQRSPDSPALEVLAADRLHYEEQYEQAAALYLKASKAEWLPEKKQQHLYSFLSAMSSAGKAAEGYAQADDAANAFETLTSGFEDEESIVPAEQLGDLLAAHRRRQPGDARIEYYEGLLRMRDKQYAQAEQKFAAALQKELDEYYHDVCRRRQAEALFRQGKMFDAYEQGGRTSDVFQQLAWLCRGENKWDELGQLIRRHRNNAIADRWIDYFMALDFQQAGRHREAYDAIRRAEEGDQEDQSLTMYCQTLKPALAIDAGELADAYADGADRRVTFAGLAQELANREDWATLGHLVSLHAAYLPTDPAAQNWHTRSLFEQENYDGIATALSPWPQFSYSAEATIHQQLHERRVRSLLRLGRREEARAAAELASVTQSFGVPMVMVLLAEGKFEQLKERLQDRSLVKQLVERPLHEDPELRPLLFTAELADFRRTLVLPLPNASLHGKFVLLQARPTTWSDESFKERLRAAGIAADDVRRLPPADGAQTIHYGVGTPQGTLVVTFGQRPYTDRDGDFQQPPPSDPALAKAIDEHAGFLAIDVSRLELEPGSGQILSTASRLAAELCGEETLAVSGWHSTGDYVLAPADADVLERLRAGTFLAQKRPLPRGTLEHALVMSATMHGEPDEDASWPKRRRELAALAEKVRAGSNEEHDIQVDLWRGQARERVWLRLVGGKPAQYGGWNFHGELTESSILWPHLKAGARVEVGQYQVGAVRMTE